MLIYEHIDLGIDVAQSNHQEPREPYWRKLIVDRLLSILAFS